MGDFFDSVGRAFERNRESSHTFEYVLLATLVAVVVLQMVAFLRRRRGKALEVAALARHRGLTEVELALVMELARQCAEPAMAVLTDPEVFERATAKALSGEVRLAPAGPELAQRIRRVREALHFDRLPAHAPLHTTRELTPGLAIETPAGPGQVSEVNERAFTVVFPGSFTLEDGQVSLRLLHAREAPYQLSCTLLERHSASAVFGHDEAPVRVQHREFSRVELSEPVDILALSWPGHFQATREVRGTFKDLSAGGALVASPAAMATGSQLALSFFVSGEAFPNVNAVVLSSKKQGETLLLHLEFIAVSPQLREQLASAVTRLQVARQATARQG